MNEFTAESTKREAGPRLFSKHANAHKHTDTWMTTGDVRFHTVLLKRGMES